jgi:hypothetical protein
VEKDITDRIEMILKAYELSASSFSDLIQVQRSAMSHIFSRRNRPSLDVIQKILNQFPEINSNWLLTGHGKMKQLNLFEEEHSLPGKIKPDPTEVPEKKETWVGPLPIPIVQDRLPDPDLLPPEKKIIVERHEPSSGNTDSSGYISHLHSKAKDDFPVPEPLPPPYTSRDIPPIPPVQETPIKIPAPSSEANLYQSVILPKEVSPDLTAAKLPGNGIPDEVPKKEKEIEKIIIFYKDKTFSSYIPE